MSKVYVFLADGFEEIEGLTVVDLLRRAGIETITISVMGREEIIGSHRDSGDSGYHHRKGTPDEGRYAGASGRHAGNSASGRL